MICSSTLKVITSIYQKLPLSEQKSKLQDDKTYFNLPEKVTSFLNM